MGAFPGAPAPGGLSGLPSGRLDNVGRLERPAGRRGASGVWSREAAGAPAGGGAHVRRGAHRAHLLTPSLSLLQAVADGVFYAELNELLMRELGGEGYSGVEVRVLAGRSTVKQRRQQGRSGRAGAAEAAKRARGRQQQEAEEQQRCRRGVRKQQRQRHRIAAAEAGAGAELVSLRHRSYSTCGRAGGQAGSLVAATGGSLSHGGSSPACLFRTAALPASNCAAVCRSA
jgi:hypothetical protein